MQLESQTGTASAVGEREEEKTYCFHGNVEYPKSEGTMRTNNKSNP